MSFLRREFLILFVGLFPLLFLLIRRYGRGRQDLSRVTGQWRYPLLLNVYTVKYFLSSLFFLLGVSATILALCGFTWGRIPEKDNREGVDLIFAVDVSRSMLAQDVSPNRLGRSLEVIRALFDQNPEARLSLLYFKGEAEVAVPITEDRYMASEFLNYLGPGISTVPGTDLESAIRLSLEQVPEGSPRNHLVMLFTDGDQLTGNGVDAARTASQRRIPLVIVGVGTQSSVPIPLEDGSFVTDTTGKQVETRLDSESLESLAQLSGGAFYSVESPQLISEIQSFIDERVEEGPLSGIIFVPRDRYASLLMLAVLFFILYKGVKTFPWKGLL